MCLAAPAFAAVWVLRIYRLISPQMTKPSLRSDKPFVDMQPDLSEAKIYFLHAVAVLKLCFHDDFIFFYFFLMV